MLADELLKAAEDALPIVQGKQPHRGELLQLAMYLHRAWEEGLDYPEQKRVHKALVAVQEAIQGQDLDRLDNLAAGEGERLRNLLNRGIRSLEFSQKLIQLREARGITPRELAARSGINNSLIYKIQRAIHAPPSPYTLARLAAGLGVQPEELGTPSFPVRSPAQVASTPTSTPTQAEAPIESPGSRHPLVAELSDYLDRLLRRSYAAVKLESADPALRSLFEDLAARLMKDDAKTRATRVKVVYRLMEAGLPLLRIVEARAGDREGKAGAQRIDQGPTAGQAAAQPDRRRGACRVASRAGGGLRAAGPNGGTGLSRRDLARSGLLPPTAKRPTPAQDPTSELLGVAAHGRWARNIDEELYGA